MSQTEARRPSNMTSETTEPWYLAIVLSIIKGYALSFDIVTWPLYFLLQKPWKHKDTKAKIRLLDPDDPSAGITRVSHDKSDDPGTIGTINRMFDIIVERRGDNPGFGTRRILRVHKEVQPDGKIFKKFELADHYEWITYRQAGDRVRRLSRALLAFGLRPGGRLAIYAETRVEWMLTAQACFRLDITIVTIFSTMNEEGVIHCLNETDVEYIITSADLMERLEKLLPNLPKLKKLVYMEGPQVSTCPDLPQLETALSFSSFEDLADTLSTDIIRQVKSPTPESLAVIMYTSGTCGIPKGVLITHENVVWASISLFNNCQLKKDHCNMAFLPLAHVMELAVEMLIMWCQQAIAYSSVLTLTDKSTGIIKGQQGDMMLVRPQSIAIVPLVLDRIKKSFENGAKEKGPLAHALLNFAIKYKIGWYRKGYSTPILDRLFFKKFRDALGGRLVFLATGGATVSQEVQDYVTACLNCEFVIGYGLTECTALCTITPTDDRVTGHVGFPGEGGYIRLADWKEGGYSTKDKPYPRGEVVIGGKSVTVGYFNNPELTKKVYEEKDGIWWFYTGDIGELLPGNRLRLIDRRKDLVKLSTGEYVALGQVESRLKSCPEVDNVCVSAAAQNRLLALVVPNYEVLKQRFGSGRSLGDMCRDPAVVRYISSMLREHGLMSGLNSREIPADCRLVADDWTPDSGLVTAALKLKRHSIEDYYRDHIQEMMNNVSSP